MTTYQRHADGQVIEANDINELQQGLETNDQLIATNTSTIAALPKPSIDTLAALGAIGGSPEQAVILRGGSTTLDGQAGIFVWDSTSTATDDGGATTLAVTGVATGRWSRWMPDGALNAQWFGAKGDGTTDDTTTLQAWLDACADQNRDGYLPPGTYLAGDLTLSGTASGTPRIFGAGWSQTTLLARTSPATGTLLTIAPASGQGSAFMTTIEHLTLNGNHIAAYGVMLADTVSRSTIRHCQVLNCTGTPGVGIANADRNFSTAIERCVITQNQIGIQFQGACQDLKVVNSQLFGNLVNQAKIGNGSASVGIVTFENCQIERANAGSGGDVTNLLVNGVLQLCLRSCYFESHTTAGSRDIVVASGLASQLYIENMFSTGNHGSVGVTPADYSIALPSDGTTVSLVVVRPRIVSFTNDPPIANLTAPGKSITIIRETGLVGQGTWSPQFPLDVAGSAKIGGSLTVGGASTLGNQLNLSGSGPILEPNSDTSLSVNYYHGTSFLIWSGAGGSGHVILRVDSATNGVSFNGGAYIKGHLSGTASWTPGSVSSGTTVSTTVTVTGAAIGDTVVVGFSQAVPGGCLLVGAVTATDTVTVTLLNQSGSSVSLALGTLRADCWKH